MEKKNNKISSAESFTQHAKRYNPFDRNIIVALLLLRLLGTLYTLKSIDLPIFTDAWHLNVWIPDFYCNRLTLSDLQAKICIFANSVDPDEMAHNEPSHQDLHCLQ